MVSFAILLSILLGLSRSQSVQLTASEAANIVRDQMKFGYKAYLKYAKGCDELYPETATCRNYNDYSLLWTPIDAIDTLALMNLTDLVKETIEIICHSGFTFHRNQTVSAFDIFIRSIGGLLSGYHFTNEQCLYDLAIDLAETIYPIFTKHKTKSGLQWNKINLLTQEIYTASAQSSPALSGSNIIEYGAISALTGDLKYFNAAKKSMQIIFDARSSLDLVGDCMDLNSDINSSKFWCGQNSYIDANIDSFFEYQAKCWALFEDSDCLHWWNVSSSAILKYMSYYKGQLLWFKRVNMMNGQNGDMWNEYDLYAAFFSAVLSLTGNMNESRMNQDANWFMWQMNNVEPFLFDFEHNKVIQSNFWLNPENIESNYYLYMITNDTVYYERALKYLDDIITFDKCNDNSICHGYAGLSDVRTKRKDNECPSYFFGETLKYLYLTFMRNEENNPMVFDDYIFNTEAHPLPKKWGRKLNEILNETKKNMS